MLINGISTSLYSWFQQQGEQRTDTLPAASSPPETRTSTPFPLVLRQTLENTEESARQLALLRIQSQAGPVIASEVVREDATINRPLLQQLLEQRIEPNVEAARGTNSASTTDIREGVNLLS